MFQDELLDVALDAEVLNRQGCPIRLNHGDVILALSEDQGSDR